jgi:hypothetical protein
MTDQLSRLADHIQNGISEQTKQRFGQDVLNNWIAPQHWAFLAAQTLREAIRAYWQEERE